MPVLSKSIWIAISVFCILLIAIVLFVTWKLYVLVPNTISYVTQQLSAASGVSPYLVRGVVYIATIPFFIAVAKSVRFGTLILTGGVGTSPLSLYRNVYGIIIVSYVGLFYVAMYYAARNSYYREQCVTTPEGLKSFATLTRDPVYGLETHPCTLAEIVELRRGDAKVVEPQPIVVSDAASYPFFDSVTAKPKVWYYRRPTGGYALFDRPGKYPGTGEELKPIDDATRAVLILEQEQQQQFAKKRAVTEAQRTNDNLRNQFVNAAVHRQNGSLQAAILLFSPGKTSVTTAERDLAAAIRARGMQPVESFFTPLFVRDGRAERLLQIDWGAVKDLDVQSRIDLIVVGSVASTYGASSVATDLTSVHTHLQLRCLDPVAQRECGEADIDSVGAGFTETEAFENSIGRAKNQMDAFVEQLRVK